MSAHEGSSTDCNAELNDPVDVALAIALDDADHKRVRELIREAQQYRECLGHQATDAEVRDAVPARGGDE